MPEKPKDQTTVEENICDDVPETGDESSWSEDIDKHDYYYDDAHGYEVYDAEADEDEEDEKEPTHDELQVRKRTNQRDL